MTMSSGSYNYDRPFIEQWKVEILQREVKAYAVLAWHTGHGANRRGGKSKEGKLDSIILKKGNELKEPHSVVSFWII